MRSRGYVWKWGWRKGEKFGVYGYFLFLVEDILVVNSNSHRVLAVGQRREIVEVSGLSGIR